MAKRAENPIPVEFRLAVYFLNLDYTEIVSAKQISPEGPTFAVHLRKGGREWKGNLKAPSWTGGVPPPIRLEDLLNSTQDCPTCEGSGKVPR